MTAKLVMATIAVSLAALAIIEYFPDKDVWLF